MNGFVMISKDIMNSWIWEDAVLYRFYTYLVMVANWKETDFLGDTLPAGAVSKSIERMSRECFMSTSQVRTAVDKLVLAKKVDVVRVGKTKRYLVLKNYDNSVGAFFEEESQTESQRESQRESRRFRTKIAKQIATDEEGKEIKNNITPYSPPRDNADVDAVVAQWNAIGGAIKPVSKILSTSTRYKHLQARLSEYGLEDVLRAVGNVASSDYLRSGEATWFTFDWFLRPNNFVKVLDGNYNHSRNVGHSTPGTASAGVATQKAEETVKPMTSDEYADLLMEGRWC